MIHRSTSGTTKHYVLARHEPHDNSLGCQARLAPPLISVDGATHIRHPQVHATAYMYVMCLFIHRPATQDSQYRNPL